MGFTENVVVFLFLLVLTILAFWWSGFLDIIGAEGPIDFLATTVSIIPGWLWAIAILFVVGGIAIERIFG